MLLHLVRHAHAVAAEDVPARPLSPRGHAEIARLARFLALSGCFQPDQVWHSPLLRSRQTADALVARLRLDVVLLETPGLLPEDDPRDLADRLALHPHDRDLAIVGHEPHLSAFASLLVRGKARPALFTLRKSSVLTLELTDSTHSKTGLARWRVRWQIAPELFPATTAPLPATLAPSVSPPDAPLPPLIPPLHPSPFVPAS